MVFKRGWRVGYNFGYFRVVFIGCGRKSCKLFFGRLYGRIVSLKFSFEGFFEGCFIRSGLFSFLVLELVGSFVVVLVYTNRGFE